MNIIELYLRGRKTTKRIMNTFKRTNAGLAPKYKGASHKRIYDAAKKAARAKLQLARRLIA